MRRGSCLNRGSWRPQVEWLSRCRSHRKHVCGSASYRPWLWFNGTHWCMDVLVHACCPCSVACGRHLSGKAMTSHPARHQKEESFMTSGKSSHSLDNSFLSRRSASCPWFLRCQISRSHLTLLVGPLLLDALMLLLRNRVPLFRTSS